MNRRISKLSVNKSIMSFMSCTTTLFIYDVRYISIRLPSFLIGHMLSQSHWFMQALLQSHTFWCQSKVCRIFTFSSDKNFEKLIDFFLLFVGTIPKYAEMLEAWTSWLAMRRASWSLLFLNNRFFGLGRCRRIAIKLFTAVQRMISWLGQVSQK